jgi:hypothetical protein
MTPLAAWQNFYVIVGSCAGALIGLQFVVITLLANRPVRQGQEEAGAAFGTPTVVHFGAALLLAAIQTAPWNGTGPVAALWCVMGLIGIVYEVVVIRRMRSQKLYAPVFEDWLCHAILPLIAYVVLAASPLLAHANVSWALFAIGAAAMLLLFVGIHNAWDAVTYHIYVRKHDHPAEPSMPGNSPSSSGTKSA